MLLYMDLSRFSFLLVIALAFTGACTQSEATSNSESAAEKISSPSLPVHELDTTTRYNPYYSRTDTTRLDLPDSVWRAVLSDAVYAVARNKGTERAFTGEYWNYTGVGIYYCGACGNALFKSDAKFASTCGWPSFYEPIRLNGVVYAHDTSHNLDRTEVLCGRCGAHLGHLFNDGPPPTGKRYCMNSVVLDFEEHLF